MRAMTGDSCKHCFMMKAYGTEAGLAYNPCVCP